MISLVSLKLTIDILAKICYTNNSENVWRCYYDHCNRY